MPGILIVANPASGRGRARRALWDLTRELARRGVSWTVHVSRARDDLRSACRSARPGYTALVAVGGDGTVGEILQEIGPAGPALAIWPAGTANLTAREVGFVPDAARLAAALVRGRTRPMDLGLCRWVGQEIPERRFAACAGAGFDARVVGHLAAGRDGAIRWIDYLGPLLAALKETASSDDDMELQADDGVVQRGKMAIVSNLVRYGGFFRIAPSARTDDGRLDAVLFERRASSDLLRHAVRALRGRLAGAPGVHVLQTGRVSIRPLGRARGAPVQVDGEPLGVLPVEIAVLPGAIRVIDMGVEA